MYKIPDHETSDDEMSTSEKWDKANELMELIESGEANQETRKGAVKNLGNYRTSGNLERMTALLLKVVQDKQEAKTIRQAAGAVLGTFQGEQVSEALIKILSDDTEDPDLHEWIQSGISAGGSSQAKSKAAEIFTTQSQSETTRTRVAECLWNSLETDEMQKVMTVFQNQSESLKIRQDAASILSFQVDASVIDTLGKFLNNRDADPEVRKHIAESVDWRLVARADVPLQILRDGNETVELRLIVLRSLFSSLCIDEANEIDLAPTLIEVLNNPNEEPQIRSEVCKALEKEFASPEVKQAIKNYKAGIN